MSFVECPDCGKKIRIFGENSREKVYESLGLKLLGELPMKASLAAMDENGIAPADAEISRIIASITNKVVETAAD